MAELGSLANDLVRLNVDVIVAGATPTSTLSRSAPATEEREARGRGFYKPLEHPGDYSTVPPDFC
jgi:hypothetical protein